MNKDMNPVCKWLGHKTSKEYTESGFLVCKRCCSHEYHNSDEWQRVGILKRPWWYVLRFSHIVNQKRRDLINRIRYGKSDLPF